ncbi:D-alanyl-D-alanine carboxypeptidase DacF [Clostridiales bacterium]|nr:D-alanyl-D-alanine carboxypeptidase DacF [Clostridiales bacterium]
MKSIKKLIIAIVMIATAFSCTVYAETPPPPETVAKSAILLNADTGRILYEKNDHARMFPASMTKLLTAMVLLDHMELDELIKVDSSINFVPWDSSRAGIEEGEIFTVETAIRGLIIPSGNDIGNVVASAVAKKDLGNDVSYKEAEKYFAGLMNQKARELGCTESNFVNPHGYHDDNHYTTAYDMSLIATAAMKYDIIRTAAAETRFSGNGAGRQKYNVDGKTSDYLWFSHNALITNNANFYSYATGIKTGFTDQAGDCIAASATKDNENLIAIIMNSEDPGRWEDSRNLFDWAFDNFDMIEYRRAGVAATAKLEGHNRLKSDTVDLEIENSLTAYLTPEEAASVEANIIYDAGGEFLKAPVEKGTEVGTVQFILDGDVIGEARAFTSVEVEKATIFNTTAYYAKQFFLKAVSRENLKFTAVGIVLILLLTFILSIRRKRRNRYKIKGNYRGRSVTYDTSQINSKRKKKRRDKYNKYR